MLLCMDIISHILMNFTMDKILLTKSKIDEIRSKIRILESSLNVQKEEMILRGGVSDSWHESASYSVTEGANKSKLKNLKSIIRRVKLLPDYVYSKKIVIGSRFVLSSKNNKIKGRLVHPIEADPSINLYSIRSKLGKILYNKKSADEIADSQPVNNV